MENTSGNSAQENRKQFKNIRLLNKLKLKSWEKRFRAEAILDRYAIFRDHMKRLELPDKPELMLEGTIYVMEAIIVFASLDKQRVSEWLSTLQNYSPSQSPNARYAFTFGLCGKAFARVMSDGIHMYPMDLADLFGYPWKNYRVAGYDSIWISHVDWSPLASEEVQKLETDVTDNLLFDYGEDEIDIWFDDTIDPCYLFVSVQDHYEEDEEEQR